MFKLVVLFAIVAVACGKPAPSLIHGGAVIGSVPTSVSHSSSSVVHATAPVATYAAAPIAYAAAPVAYAAPAYSTYAAHGIHGIHGIHGYHGGAVLAAPGYGYGYGGLYL